MSPSNPTLIPVWVSPFGGLTEVDVPADLWARAMNLPQRKHGRGFDNRFKEVKETVAAMEEIAFRKWEGPSVFE